MCLAARWKGKTRPDCGGSTRQSCVCARERRVGGGETFRFTQKKMMDVGETVMLCRGSLLTRLVYSLKRFKNSDSPEMMHLRINILTSICMQSVTYETRASVLSTKITHLYKKHVYQVNCTLGTIDLCTHRTYEWHVTPNLFLLSNDMKKHLCSLPVFMSNNKVIYYFG